MKEEFLDKIWESNPDYIRKFYENQPMNEKLCNEVKYILSMELNKENIETAQISARTKTLKSFCEKISRKSYKNPFKDISDFAGARIVYLYSSDLEQIESIIEREFKITEKVDKISSEDADRFGYGALHYLLKIKKKHSGARYDDLKDLVCEVQVRTILQDAWAIVAHHLSYKQESDVPKELRRKLNALSGVFETADDQFENIRLARSNYQDKVKESITTEKEISLKEKINLDNLDAYMKWKFPDRGQSDLEVVAALLGELKEFNYIKLKDIEIIIDKTKKAVNAYETKYPPLTEDTLSKKTKFKSVGIIRTSLAFANPDYVKKTYNEQRKKRLSEFLYLVE